VTLSQLRSELSRLETDLTTQVKRVEKVASKPPPRPPIVITPPPPAPVKPELPIEGLAIGALSIAGLAGAAGFGLGQWWAKRPAPAGAERAARAEAEKGTAAEARPWSQIHQRLDAAQQRLSLARSRIRRLERGA
jgi:hypothetical protein